MEFPGRFQLPTELNPPSPVAYREDALATTLLADTHETCIGAYERAETRSLNAQSAWDRSNSETFSGTSFRH